MKSTTYIVEITNQKNEKYLSEGRNPLACLPPYLLALCQPKNFLCEFTEKCFAVFGQSSCTIYLTWYHHSYFSGNFLLSFLLWYDFKILVKSRGGGTFLSLASSVLFGRSIFFFFFQFKAKYPVFHFLNLDRTILNLI